MKNMEYGLTINNGRLIVGGGDEIKGVIIGALLASGFRENKSVQVRADEVMQAASERTGGQPYRVDLGSLSEMQVWGIG
jgi:hypothetical protein